MAGKFTQDGRAMAVATPLPKDALLLERLHGTEGLSELFTYDLDLLAQPGQAVPFDKLIGQPLTVTLVARHGQKSRFVNGIVSRVSQGGVVRGPTSDQPLTRYTATVVPALWKLTKTHRSRIFQQKSVPDILKIVFKGIDADYRLTGHYEPRDYCSQYQETDFAFASRLMEEEGIFYYFKHEDGKHTLVLGDASDAHDPVPGTTALIFDDADSPGENAPEDRVRRWAKTQELRSGKVTLWDHCFELPPDHLEADKATQDSVQVGTVSHKLAVGGNDRLEVYEYPGRYAQRFDGIDPAGGERAADVRKIFQDNKRAAGLRMQQEAAAAVSVQAESTVRTVTAGHRFNLTGHPDGNGEYVVRRAEVWGDLRATYHTRERDDLPEFRNSFAVLPVGLPFRPPATTPKGRIHGVQAGTVVGPKGEEIFTDKYGRVKVQFRWDRDGKQDSGSSCWVRVGSMWAGKQWGMVHIPRIGQEVLVAFEEGDPDRPIIVGSVYNAEQMPPYKLPDHRTRSGIKSRSTLNGTPDNFNELYFEDKKGEELVYFHAEKDFFRVVENNDKTIVGMEDRDKGDQELHVHNDQWVEIGAKATGNGGPALPTSGDQWLYVWNNRQVVVGNGETDAADGSLLTYIWNNEEVAVGNGHGACKDGSQLVDIWNNQEVAIGSGKGQNKDGSQIMSIWKNRTAALKTGDDTLLIEKGNQTETLKMGNRTVELSMGNDALTLKLGNRTTKLNLGADSTEALQGITLKVGASKVVVDQTGVSIEGMMIKINGQMMTDIKGMMTTISGSALCKLGGGITMIG